MKISLGLKKVFVVFLAVALAAVAFAGVIPSCKSCCCCAKFAGETLSASPKKCCCSDKAGITGGCSPKAKKPSGTEAVYDSSRPQDGRGFVALVTATEKISTHAIPASQGFLSLPGESPPCSLHARIRRFDC